MSNIEQWFTQFTSTITGLFFVFSWGYFVIKIHKLENKVKKLKKKNKE